MVLAAICIPVNEASPVSRHPLKTKPMFYPRFANLPLQYQLRAWVVSRSEIQQAVTKERRRRDEEG